MTSRQRIKLMAEWWPDACTSQGWNKNDREKRIEILSQALGREITSANEIETNEDVDAVKAHLLALARPADLTAQLDQANMPRTRAIHAILGFGFSEQYIAAISEDRYGTQDWRSLDLSLLTGRGQLRDMLSNRARANKARAKQQLQTVPADEDEPF